MAFIPFSGIVFYFVHVVVDESLVAIARGVGAVVEGVVLSARHLRVSQVLPLGTAKVTLVDMLHLISIDSTHTNTPTKRKGAS